MKTEKVYYRLSVITAIIAGILLFNSCQLAEGLLDSEIIADLEGEWNCDETSDYTKKAATPQYVVTLSADSENQNGIIIDNFYQLGGLVNANVSGLTITLLPQPLPAGCQLISGSGTISSNHKTITWTYQINIGGSAVDHVTAVYTKR